MKHYYSAATRRLILCLVFLALSGVARAQTPTWRRALALTSLAPQEATIGSTAFDVSGNLYIAGTFSGTLSLGSLGVSSVGGLDGFVAKYNPATATFLWVLRCGGTANDGLGTLAVVGTTVYVAGSFSSPTIAIGPTTLTNAGAVPNRFEGFVAKLTDAGTSASFGWAQQVSGSGNESVAGVVATPAGLFLAGNSDSPSLVLGTTTLPNPPPTLGGGTSGYLARLTDAGSSVSVAWVLPVQGNDNESVNCLAAAGGALYVGGNVTGTALQIGNTSIATTAQKSFLAKLDVAGTPAGATWVVPLSTPVTPTALAVSGSNVYVAGRFYGPRVVIGATTLTNTDPRTTNSSDDIFVARLTDAGPTASIGWAVQAGGESNDDVAAIAVNGANVYITGGFFSANATFGNTTLFNTLSPAAIGIDSEVYVAQLNDAGAIAGFGWALQGSGAGTDYAYALAVRGSSVYVGGSISGSPTTFGNLSIANPSGAYLGFLAYVVDTAGGLATASAAALPGVEVFPNPAHHAATVQAPQGAASATLTLADALGRTARTYTGNFPQALDLTGLTPGIYTLTVRTGATVTVRRLLVE
jgi:hypothetical protein